MLKLFSEATAIIEGKAKLRSLAKSEKMHC